MFRKLQLGTRTAIHVLNAPEAFEPALAALVALEGVAIRRTVAGPVDFALAFVKTEAELAAASTTLARACAGDGIVWMACPKSSSTRHRCEFNRDGGWPALAAAGFEPVRIVALDDDWSALRFRRVEFIPRLSRHPDRAISRAGRQKARGRQERLHVQPRHRP